MPKKGSKAKSRGWKKKRRRRKAIKAEGVPMGGRGAKG